MSRRKSVQKKLSIVPSPRWHGMSIVLLLLLTPLMLWGQWWMWQHQFEADTRYDVVKMQPDHELPMKVMRGHDMISWHRLSGQLSLAVQAGKERPTVEIPLDAWPQNGYVQVKVQMRGVGLVKGEDDWALARGIVLWRDRRGGCYPDHIPVVAVKGDELITTQGVVPLKHDGRAFFCMQHLGLAGLCRVEALELQLLRRCAWFTPVQLVFAVLWCGWWWLAWRSVGSVQKWDLSRFVAMVVAYGIFHFFVFPGPYLPLRGIQQSFVVDQPTMPPSALPLPSTHEHLVRFELSASNVSGDVPSRGEMGWCMEVLVWIKKQMRPLFHGLGFALFSLFFLVLLNGRRGLLPVIALALCSEGMQFLYGFGFGLEDVVDLIINGGGIWLGWRCWKYLVQLMHEKQLVAPKSPKNSKNSKAAGSAKKASRRRNA